MDKTARILGCLLLVSTFLLMNTKPAMAVGQPDLQPGQIIVTAYTGITSTVTVRWSCQDGSPAGVRWVYTCPRAARTCRAERLADEQNVRVRDQLAFAPARRWPLSALRFPVILRLGLASDQRTGPKQGRA
jgi:hypothetical protein